MTNPIPWWKPQIGAAEYDLIKQVLDSNYINEGEFTHRFERRMAELLGVEYAVAVTSGTAALYLALLGIGVGPEVEVIVPDVTFIATVNAVKMTGAMPVLVDVNPRTLTMDPGAFASAITLRTKAVIPVHISGRAANLPALLRIAEENRVLMIEDAAEALLSKCQGRFLGTFGKAGCLSFSPNKTITTGQGGMILTDDVVLYNRICELKDQGRRMRGTGGDDIHPSIGFNFKLTNLQAAVGLGQLSYLVGRIRRMKEIYCQYVEQLQGTVAISFPGFDLSSGESPQWIDALVDGRDSLEHALRSRNIECRKFWLPIHRQIPYQQPDDAFPNSTTIGRHALWLPSAFTLSDDDVARVCYYIRESLSN